MAVAYDGNEPYIFISYSHKDTADVLNAVDALNDNGFRVWYDNGIEAGTEWPEYIAERMINCQIVIAFMSKNSQDSHNCRREIHFAIELKKELLVVYLEDFDLSPGMRLQLSAIQAMYRSKCKDDADFLSRLCNAAILQKCKAEPEAEAVAPTPIIVEEPAAMPEVAPIPVPIPEPVPIPMPKEIEAKPEILIEPEKPIFAQNEQSFEMNAALIKGINAANDLSRSNKALHRFAYANELSKKQMENAVSSIAKGKISQNEILALLDDTIASSGKSGYLVTNDRFFGSSTFMDTFEFELSELSAVEMSKKDHITYTLSNGRVYDKLLSGDCLYVYTMLDEFLKAKSTVSVLDANVYDSVVADIGGEAEPKASRAEAIERAIHTCNADNSVRKSFYFKFPEELSQKQLENAVSAVAKNKISESDIIAVMDDTVRGNGKSGYIVTSTHFYSGGTGILSTNFELELDGLYKVEVCKKDHLLFKYANGKQVDYFFSIYTGYFEVFFQAYLKEID